MNSETAIVLRSAVVPPIALMDSESLGRYVADEVRGVLVRLKQLMPYVEELWRRFDKGETICGCRTKTEFCNRYLRVSMRAVQHHLYGRPAKDQSEHCSLPEGRDDRSEWIEVPLRDLSPNPWLEKIRGCVFPECVDSRESVRRWMEMEEMTPGLLNHFPARLTSDGYQIICGIRRLHALLGLYGPDHIANVQLFAGVPDELMLRRLMGWGMFDPPPGGPLGEDFEDILDASDLVAFANRYLQSLRCSLSFAGKTNVTVGEIARFTYMGRDAVKKYLSFAKLDERASRGPRRGMKKANSTKFAADGGSNDNRQRNARAAQRVHAAIAAGHGRDVPASRV